MTNNTALQDAMGLIDEKYIDEVIHYRPAHRRTQGRWIRWGTLAACLCLIIGLGVKIISPTTKADNIPYAQLNLPPVDPDQIIWDNSLQATTTSASSVPTYDAEFDTADSMVLMQQNGWNLSGELYLALKRADSETYIAILVRRSYDYTAMMNFSYLGKTRAQWQVEHEILNTQQRKLGEFSKEGQWLKYGEALYTTGTPDGERWSKSLYEERVNFYGEYFISQYVHNGELLSEKISQEMADNNVRLAELSEILVDLNDAYIAQNAQEDLVKFAAEQVHYAYKNGSLYLFVTKDELEHLRISKKSKYMLYLANRDVFDYEEGVTSIPIDETVTGFDCSKITFYTDGVRYHTVSTDVEVHEALRYLSERWQYTEDSIMIEIYSSPQLTKEQLASMHYSTIYFSPSSPSFASTPSLILMNIKMKYVNTEAIRDLSLLEQVTSIHIGPTLTAENTG